jgi:hypothetical protein
MFCDLICLPLLEGEAKAFITVVLIVGLTLMVFDTVEVAVDRFRVLRESDQGIDDCSFRNDSESPRLRLTLVFAMLEKALI